MFNKALRKENYLRSYSLDCARDILSCGWKMPLYSQFQPARLFHSLLLWRTGDR